MKIFLFLCLILGICAVSFGLTAGIVYLVCLCFSIAFSWKIALGVWLIILLFNPVVPKK